MNSIENRRPKCDNIIVAFQSCLDYETRRLETWLFFFLVVLFTLQQNISNRNSAIYNKYMYWTRFADQVQGYETLIQTYDQEVTTHIAEVRIIYMKNCIIHHMWSQKYP